MIRKGTVLLCFCKPSPTEGEAAKTGWRTGNGAHFGLFLPWHPGPVPLLRFRFSFVYVKREFGPAAAPWWFSVKWTPRVMMMGGVLLLPEGGNGWSRQVMTTSNSFELEESCRCLPWDNRKCCRCFGRVFTSSWYVGTKTGCIIFRQSNPHVTGGRISICLKSQVEDTPLSYKWTLLRYQFMFWEHYTVQSSPQPCWAVTVTTVTIFLREDAETLQFT